MTLDWPAYKGDCMCRRKKKKKEEKKRKRSRSQLIRVILVSLVLYLPSHITGRAHYGLFSCPTCLYGHHILPA